jgi:hypothetical protein
MLLLMSLAPAGTDEIQCPSGRNNAAASLLKPFRKCSKVQDSRLELSVTAHVGEPGGRVTVLPETTTFIEALEAMLEQQNQHHRHMDFPSVEAMDMTLEAFHQKPGITYSGVLMTLGELMDLPLADPPSTAKSRDHGQVGRAERGSGVGRSVNV